MGLGATLKKGLKFLLMSFGASSPPKKPVPTKPEKKRML
jgi:hypothetical protein